MKKILFINLCLFVIIDLLAQNITYNQEFELDLPANLGSMVRKNNFCVLDNGNYVYSWEDDDGSQRGTYAQIYSENGTSVGTTFLVNSYKDHMQIHPCISALNNGGFIACWQSRGQEGGYPSFGIYGQLFDENGHKVGNEFSVNTYTDSQQEDSKITVLKNGRIVICWQSFGQDGSGDGVYAQMFSESGIKIGYEFRVNTTTSNRQFGPDICSLESGGFVICWYSSEGYDLINDVHAQVYDSNGLKVGNELKVNTNLQKTYITPSISGLTNGGFVISWNSMALDGSWAKVNTQLFDDSGTKVGDGIKVNSLFPSGHPNVCNLNNGRFVVCWYGGLLQDMRIHIYAQIFDENGFKVGKEYMVNSYTEGSQYEPKISMLNEGGFVIFWSSYSTPNGEHDGVYGKYYLGEPIDHNLRSFDLLEPELDATLNYTNPKFEWNQASDIHINFPWELTYDLFIDSDINFTNPLISAGIKGTTYQIDSLAPGQTYFWKVLARNFAGDSLWSSDVFGFYIESGAVTGVKEIAAPLPKEFELFQNYPNPFNPTTKIQFTIPDNVISTPPDRQAGEGRNLGDFSSSSTSRNDNRNVLLQVYDILGNEIATLVNEQKQPGTYEVELNGEGFTSGIYFYKLSVDEKFSEVKKMLLLK